MLNITDKVYVIISSNVMEINRASDLYRVS